MHTENKDKLRIKRMVGLYNMVPNLLWSVLNLVPVCIYCYTHVSLKWLYIFLVPGLLTLLLPKSFFDSIQLGRTPAVYKMIGVEVVNRLSQDGKLINELIRKRFPHYNVVSNKKQSVNRRLAQTYMFEKFHFMMFVLFMLITAYALRKNDLAWALLITANNIVYNVYPNLLQQYIRIRLRPFKNRIQQ